MTEGIISFNEWSKIDLRVAQIKGVEDIEGADKLFKLTLDLGKLGERIICAGIKPYYKKEDLQGMKIILFENLEPRTIRGIESQGMLLAAGNEKGKVILISPEKDIESGSRIG